MTRSITTPWGTRVLVALIYFLMVGVAYLIMLLVMTYNVGVLIATVLGIGAGHFLMSLFEIPKLPVNHRISKQMQLYHPRSD